MFNPFSSLQRVCSTLCAIAFGRSDRGRKHAEAAKRAETREAKAKLETLPELTRKAQRAFNRYIRARDYGLPCISCGTPHAGVRFGGAWDSGHFRSTGAAPHLRFEPSNAAGQCVRCNRDLSGNSVGYRQGLIKRIGLQAVEAMETDNETRKWTRDELRGIARHFNRLARQLEVRRDKAA